MQSTPDVQISRFDKDASTSKTAFARSQLAKRFLVNRAQQRAVPIQSLSNTSNTHEFSTSSTDPHAATSLAATLAASVAVSVAQPFLKLQNDLEQKMNSVLNQIQEQQRRSNTGGFVVPVTALAQPSSAVDSSKLLTDCVDTRMKYMEKVQEQQQQVLKQLVDMAHTTKPASHSPTRVYQNSEGVAGKLGSRETVGVIFYQLAFVFQPPTPCHHHRNSITFSIRWLETRLHLFAWRSLRRNIPPTNGPILPHRPTSVRAVSRALELAPSRHVRQWPSKSNRPIAVSISSRHRRSIARFVIGLVRDLVHARPPKVYRRTPRILGLLFLFLDRPRSCPMASSPDQYLHWLGMHWPRPMHHSTSIWTISWHPRLWNRNQCGRTTKTSISMSASNKSMRRSICSMRITWLFKDARMTRPFFNRRAMTRRVFSDWSSSVWNRSLGKFVKKWKSNWNRKSSTIMRRKPSSVPRNDPHPKHISLSIAILPHALASRACRKVTQLFQPNRTAMHSWRRSTDVHCIRRSKKTANSRTSNWSNRPFSAPNNQNRSSRYPCEILDL